MSQPSVLIVGAGAMGMVNGYHLQLGGTQITYLVRPGRSEAFRAPRQLYCYDDHQLKTFDGYAVVDDVAALRGRVFDYVLVTLDGAASRTPESTAMFRALGEAIAGERTILIIGGVGVGLREHILDATRLPPQRVLNAALALLAHQGSAEMPVHAPTRAELRAQAAIAYHHFPNRASLFIDSSDPAAARTFIALYDRSGVSRCVMMNKTVAALMGNIAFPMLAVSEIAGWPKINELVANRELWHLGCRAQNEIAALPQFGWIGKLMSVVMNDFVSASLHRKVEKDSMPLDYQAFNRYHHGSKVHSQNVQVMRNCMELGRRQGRPMKALGALLDRLDAHQKQAV